MNQTVRKIRNCIYLYKLFLVIAVFIVLFFQTALNKTTPLPSFIDELILSGILVYTLIKSFEDEVVRRLVKLYFVAFFTLFLFSLSSIASRGLVSVILQIFIHLKYILFFSFIWMSFGARYSLQLSVVCLAVTIAFLIINLATGNYFNELFELPIQNRAGSIRPVGIQADTASLGTTFALIGCLLVSGMKNISTKFKVLLLLAFSLLVVLSSVRTALVLIPLIVLWWLKDSMKSFMIALCLILVVLIPLKSSDYIDELVDITAQNIEWTVDNPVESGYIRGIMIYFSFELANDRFPLGTGAATFGTVTSDDSPIYAEIGMQNSRFFVDKEGIYDSNFASILGEFGYLGLILYYGIFYFVVTAPMKKSRFENTAEFRFVFFLLICAYSIATPIFMNTYPAFIMALTLTASFRKIND